jgi:glycosyltransferase involved in cell wall biosynthesis
MAETLRAPDPVFLITHEFYPVRGGIATFTEEIAKAGTALGFSIHVWAQSAAPSSEKRWPFTLKRLPLKGSHGIICQLRLAKELITHRRMLRKATVYLPEPGPMLTMMLLQFIRGFTPNRLILTFHGSEILKFSANPFRRMLGRNLIKKATRISTLSIFTQELLLAHFPEAKGKIFLTPGALRSDFALVPNTPKQKKDKLIILTVGRLHPRKGQLLTLQALQRLAQDVRSKIEYWIVSGQSKEGYDERVILEASKTPDLSVKLLHDLPDNELSDVYESADIFALTSTPYENSIEGFGLVYLEAAAHGLPVIAHAIGGVSEAVLDQVTGFLVPPDRPAQLAAAFETLIHDEPLRKKLGAAGKALALKTTWSDSAQALFKS